MNDHKLSYGFNLGEVRLTDGVFKESQDLGKDFIMKLDADRLLAPVAYATGASDDKSAFYGGWEAYSYRTYNGTGISGHSLGHYMSALAAMYASTGDEAVKERLNYTVNRLETYQQIDGSGFIGGFEKSGFENALKNGMKVSNFDLSGYWVPWYSLHKIYQGLVDAYVKAGNKKALNIVCKFADWAINVTKDLTEDEFSEMLNCEYGGMNEVMAELYNITGEKKYFDLALRFSQEKILEPLSNSLDELEGKHANTQIPKVLGAAAIYEIDKSRTDYRQAAEFFYDTVVNHRSYVIGGNSNYEHFGNIHEEVLSTQTLETCNTHNMMKLAEYLYRWEHKSSYMDYYERALFNHILASQDPKTGEKTYFMATKQGHFKVYSDALEGNSFWCCVGSGMENPGRYTRNIYYHDGNKFYVNQFISSSVSWKIKGVNISQNTNYPYEDTTVIKINKGKAVFEMNIRIPEWICDEAEIQVNNEEKIKVNKCGYYSIIREWNEGDVVRVKLPMGLHTYTARDSVNKVAFMYGPVVLAGALGSDVFPECDCVDDHTCYDSFESIDVKDIIVPDKNPNTFIKMYDSKKLEFILKFGDEEIKLIPYSNLHHQRYTLYWNLYGVNENIKKDEFLEKLEKVTIDTVRPNEQQPEVDHNMQTKNSYSGYCADMAKGWRIAVDDGFFSYDMNIGESKDKLYLMVLYRGNDCNFDMNGKTYSREFDVFADDFKLATQMINNSSDKKKFYVYYEIPQNNFGNKITVKFKPTGEGKAAGGVFEVRITTEKVI